MKKSLQANDNIIHKGDHLYFVKRGRWEFVHRPNCTGLVVIIPITKNNEVVFVEQHRPPVKTRVLELPAGLIDDKKSSRGESVLRAAQRELLEETGYSASRMKVVFCGPISAGLTDDMVTFVLARGLKKVSSGGGDECEDITVHVIALAQVEKWIVKMIKKGFNVEPKIFAGLYWINKILKDKS